MKMLSRKIPQGHNSLARKDMRRIWLGGILATLLMITALLSACGEVVTKSPSMTEAPCAEIPKGECCGSDGTYTCNGLDSHRITLDKIPDGISPELLEISPEQKDALLDADKETNIGCVFVIVGDLVFRDSDNNLITTGFSSSITYTLTETDQEPCNNHIQSLIDQKTIKAVDDIEYIPVYFSENEGVWKLFDAKTANVIRNEDGTITVTLVINSWGDRPIGGGTKP